jgi:hypothetical protein
MEVQKEAEKIFFTFFKKTLDKIDFVVYNISVNKAEH